MFPHLQLFDYIDLTHNSVPVYIRDTSAANAAM